jgi:hypothetical protein
MSNELGVFAGGRTSCFPKVYDHLSPEISSMKAIGAFGAANPYVEIKGKTSSGGWDLEARASKPDAQKRITITLDARAKARDNHIQMESEFEHRVDLPRLSPGTYQIFLKDFEGRDLSSTTLTMFNPY